MFSGLTNQVNNWMGKKPEEEVPKPEGEPQPPSPKEEENIEVPERKESRLVAVFGVRLRSYGVL